SEPKHRPTRAPVWYQVVRWSEWSSCFLTVSKRICSFAYESEPVAKKLHRLSKKFLQLIQSRLHGVSPQVLGRHLRGLAGQFHWSPVRWASWLLHHQRPGGFRLAAPKSNCRRLRSQP